MKKESAIRAAYGLGVRMFAFDSEAELRKLARAFFRAELMPHQARLVAAAAAGHRTFLLADEPTGNVDPGLGRRLLRLFLELNKLGTSVIIATHDYAIMDTVSARRMVLGDGRLRIEE